MPEERRSQFGGMLDLAQDQLELVAEAVLAQPVCILELRDAVCTAPCGRSNIVLHVLRREPGWTVASSTR